MADTQRVLQEMEQVVVGIANKLGEEASQVAPELLDALSSHLNAYARKNAGLDEVESQKNSNKPR